jgi:hypothetical protein
LRLLDDLGWSETIDHETVTLTMPPDELTRTLARLHEDAAGALGVYVSRPKEDEEFAQRDLAASEAIGEILGRLAEPRRRRSRGELVSAAKPTSEEAVAKALASATEMTGAEIATATGLGRPRSARRWPLERDGTVRRHRGGHDGRRRLPDRWSTGHSAERDDRARTATQRLRPGQLDGLVVDHIDSQGTDAVGATAVAIVLLTLCRLRSPQEAQRPSPCWPR